MSNKDFHNYVLAVREAYECHTTIEPGMVFHIKMSNNFVKYLKDLWTNLICQENIQDDCNYIGKQDHIDFLVKYANLAYINYDTPQFLMSKVDLGNTSYWFKEFHIGLVKALHGESTGKIQSPLAVVKRHNTFYETKNRKPYVITVVSAGKYNANCYPLTLKTISRNN